MEQNEVNNEEEKQNLEEEELDEDEEEKESEKEENDNNKKEDDENKDNTDEKKVEVQNEEKPNEEREITEKEVKIEEKEQNPEKKEEKEENIEKIEENDKKVEEKNENVEEKEIIEEKIEEKKEEIENKEEKIEEKENIQKELANNENANISDNKNINEEKVEKLNINEEVNLATDKKEKVNEENPEEEEVEEEEKYEEQKESTTTYILKYTRKSNEPRESAYDKELIKSKHCLFMIEFKILKKKEEKYLLLYCHEIAAIYFDEIYEKKFSLKDLYKENRHFRIFNDIEDAKNVIDEILNNNSSNSKKIFIDIKENVFRLHIIIKYFDKENEIIFNVPKKDINDKEKIRILPEFLKEIQIKMNHLEEDNKKLKNENKIINENENDFFGEKNEMNNTNLKKNKSVTGKAFRKNMIKK